MLKKYKESAKMLTANQLKEIKGGKGATSPAPYCDESTPCPNSCDVVPHGSLGWECMGGMFCWRVRC